VPDTSKSKVAFFKTRLAAKCKSWCSAIWRFYPAYTIHILGVKADNRVSGI